MPSRPSLKLRFCVSYALRPEVRARLVMVTYTILVLTNDADDGGTVEDDKIRRGKER